MGIGNGIDFSGRLGLRSGLRSGSGLGLDIATGRIEGWWLCARSGGPLRLRPSFFSRRLTAGLAVFFRVGLSMAQTGLGQSRGSGIGIDNILDYSPALQFGAGAAIT